MNKQKIRVELQILGNTYSLMCDPHARSLFIEAAEQLNRQPLIAGIRRSFMLPNRN